MDQKIVFYDGECGFCNRTVQFILDREKEPHVLRFAALQSDFARHFFEEHQLPQPDFSTFYFWDGDRMYSKSSGALRLLNYLKPVYSLLKIGYAAPRFLRDKVYDFVAARRHKLAPGFCALPTPEQRQRFLD